MSWEVYGAREAGLNGRFCLRDPETRRCYRDADGRLYTYPDAVTAEAAKPVAVKRGKEAEVIAEPAEEIKSRIVSKAGK
jgi:hypothetical protein